MARFESYDDTAVHVISTKDHSDHISASTLICALQNIYSETVQANILKYSSSAQVCKMLFVFVHSTVVRQLVVEGKRGKWALLMERMDDRTR
jgi:hypothetical protein